MTRKISALEQSWSEVREEGRKAVEAVRQAVAAKAGLSDLEVKHGARCVLLLMSPTPRCFLFPERFSFHSSVRFRSQTSGRRSPFSEWRPDAVALRILVLSGGAERSTTCVMGPVALFPCSACLCRYKQ